MTYCCIYYLRIFCTEILCHTHIKYKGKLNLISSRLYNQRVCANFMLIRILFIQTYKRDRKFFTIKDN